MEKISFLKMSGAGNDFIVIDKSLNTKIVLTNNLIQRLCHRHNGIGADGVILIENNNNFDFSMEYFNSDGSTGTLCANGARCAIKYAGKSGRISGKSTSFLSGGTEYNGNILNDGLIKFILDQPKNVNKNILIDTFGYNLPASFADTGSPHVVLDLDDLKSTFTDEIVFNKSLVDFPVVKFGREIRYDKQFEPGGTNVNFIEVKNEKIHIRTYERGIEGETMACGTGAVASAIIGCIKYGLVPPLTLVTIGSDTLKVNFEIKGTDIKNISLTGPAVEVFKGEVSIN